VPLQLTRKQSMWLGLGLLASFFFVSGVIIYQRNNVRVPNVSTSLTKESIEGTPAVGAGPDDGAQAVGTPGSGLGFVLNDFHRSLVRDGKTVWEIHGQRGQYDALNSKAHIEKPDLSVVRDNGDTVKVTSERANLLLSGTQLSSAELYDNVVVVYKDTTIVKTSRAFYHEKEGRLDVPVPVELDSPMFTLQGNKLEAFLDPQDIFITNGVRSTIKPRKK
jgi:LPS export ABC transporter protein LptC